MNTRSYYQVKGGAIQRQILIGFFLMVIELLVIFKKGQGLNCLDSGGQARDDRGE